MVYTSTLTADHKTYTPQLHLFIVIELFFGRLHDPFKPKNDNDDDDNDSSDYDDNDSDDSRNNNNKGKCCG